MNKPRLLVIPNDALKDYDAKGYSREERNSYFNPNNEFEVSVLGFKEHRDRIFEYAGFPIYPLNERLEGLDSVLRQTQPDLVRGYNGGWAAELSGEIGKKLKIPSFASVHDMDPTPSLNLIDRVFCVSEAVKNKCLRIGVKKDNFKVLYEGIDLSLFRDYRNTEDVEEIKEMWPGKHRTISVGRLVWQKNLENLIKSLKIVEDNLGDLTHIHIGKFGELEKEISYLVDSLKLKRFYLLPNQTQDSLARFYSWADAFTMFSVSEGFGLIYIEALACGTPVVTSNIPPMNSFVFDGFNGLTENPENPEEMAGQIIRILTDKELKEKTRLNARKSVEKYDVRDLKKLEARLYKELL